MGTDAEAVEGEAEEVGDDVEDVGQHDGERRCDGHQNGADEWN